MDPGAAMENLGPARPALCAMEKDRVFAPGPGTVHCRRRQYPAPPGRVSRHKARKRNKRHTDRPRGVRASLSAGGTRRPVIKDPTKKLSEQAW